MGDEPLWRRLTDDPADREAAEMLADVLQSDGAPSRRVLGELIALGLELSREPRWRRRILRQTNALREAHAAALLGPLADAPPLEREVPAVRAAVEWGCSACAR
jgi:alkylhydroperoxidase family enzyme